MHEDLVLRVKSIAKKSPAIGLEESRRSERPDDNSCLLVVGGAHADIIPPSSSNSDKSYLCASPSSWILPLAWAKVAHWNWLFGLGSAQPGLGLLSGVALKPVVQEHKSIPTLKVATSS
ncbi:unnamed protein product [Prunus armeniaca]